MTSGRKTRLSVVLPDEERKALETWQRATTMKAGLVKRARIILMLSEGATISRISQTKFSYFGSQSIDIAASNVASVTFTAPPTPTPEQVQPAAPFC